MSVIHKKLLEEFYAADSLKQPRPAKFRLARKYGYDTPEAYLAHLKEEIGDQPTEDVIETPVIRNVHILDASGSMGGSKIANAIKGINDEISELRQNTTVRYFQTIVSFSYGNDILTHAMDVPVNLIPVFNTHTRGMTALYQAIGETLQKLIDTSMEGAKTLVKIFTDGSENNSRGEWRNADILSDFIKECQDKHDFTITFVGTKNDVAKVITRLGIDESNTLIHDNTAQGVERSFNKSVHATKAYSDKVKRGDDVSRGFYKH
jgi:uncharacterized protein YegL